MSFRVALVALLAVASCGGSKLNEVTTHQCRDTLAPCGGELVGHWKVDSACLDLGTVLAGDTCPERTFDPSGLVLSGSYDFASDATYLSQLQVSGSVRSFFPDACEVGSDPAVACADRQREEEADQDNVASSTCTKTSSGCSCRLAYKPMLTEETGSWSTSGAELTLNTTAGQLHTESYCVQGSVLHLLSYETETDGGNAGSRRLISGIVLRK